MGILLLVCFLALLALVMVRREKDSGLLLAVAGDEDIKIAPDSFSAGGRGEDTAEYAARQFLHQREVGNIDKARELGIIFANGILGNTAISMESQLDAPDYTQQVLLYSYVVNLVIQHKSPNSILAQTALNVFYKELEDNSKETYATVSDMASFSLYILCERTRSNSKDCIGETFAKLCGRTGAEFYIQRGNMLYERFYDFCQSRLAGVRYVTD